MSGGLTQAELAEHADLSLKYVGEIERDEANTTLEVLERLAAAVGCNPMDALEARANRSPRGAGPFLLSRLGLRIQDAGGPGHLPDSRPRIPTGRAPQARINAGELTVRAHERGFDDLHVVETAVVYPNGTICMKGSGPTDTARPTTSSKNSRRCGRRSRRETDYARALVMTT
jgi:transcriptional regulator with XRE-family HTH domain